MSLRVGVAPGTTAFAVRGPDLGQFKCLNCAGPHPLQGPLVNGRLDLAGMGICPPDPVVQFLTPSSSMPMPVAAPPRARSVVLNPYGTESTMQGASPLGVSWLALAGIFGAALAGGGAIGWATRRRKRR